MHCYPLERDLILLEPMKGNLHTHTFLNSERLFDFLTLWLSPKTLVHCGNW